MIRRPPTRTTPLKVPPRTEILASPLISHGIILNIHTNVHFENQVSTRKHVFQLKLGSWTYLIFNLQVCLGIIRFFRKKFQFSLAHEGSPKPTYPPASVWGSI